MAEAANQQANAPARVVLSPEEGETVWLRKLGIRFMIGGGETQGNFALVEHPIGPRALAAPMHTHRYEDEYTYRLEMDMASIPVLAERHGLLPNAPHPLRSRAREQRVGAYSSLGPLLSRYSPKLVEEEFCELRVGGVLRSCLAVARAPLPV